MYLQNICNIFTYYYVISKIDKLFHVNLSVKIL
jgi:hypothetical protein